MSLPSLALPPEIQRVATLLRDLRAPWAIAGGWALDLALGRVTRPHADVDVAVFRDDQDAVRGALPGWRFEAAVRGALVPWEPGVRLELPVHEVHIWPPSGSPIELLLNEREDADWVYRRDPAVRLPLALALREVAGGVWVLAPEVVLLYKSRAPRPTDEADFHAAQPALGGAARAWLREALLRGAPEHPWALALATDA